MQAPAPPNLRESTDPVRRCGGCKMFSRTTATEGKCWGYGNVIVRDGQVCDSYEPDPTRGA